MNSLIVFTVVDIVLLIAGVIGRHWWREWRGMNALVVRVVGHADPTPIAPRNRDRFPDNYALSAARAQGLEVLPQRVHVGPDGGQILPVDGLVEALHGGPGGVVRGLRGHRRRAHIISR